MATRLAPVRAANANASDDAKAIIRAHNSNEMWFGVVGPVGAGGSRAITALEKACRDAGYEPEVIKMSALIRAWAERNNAEVPPTGPKTLEGVRTFQNLGDDIRKLDPSGVARLCLKEIAERRAQLTGQEYQPGRAVKPDGKKRAWLIDSIRHPAETTLFRRAYGHSFALVGVVCEEEIRRKRIREEFLNKLQQQEPMAVAAVNEFIDRDAEDVENSYGQHVTDAFHQSDFFVDNTENDEQGVQGFLDEPVARLVSIIAHDRLIRPTIEETAMHHAHSARVRSACLSRQVGAALVDLDGTVISTGTNEVPRAGGGVYGEQFASARAADDQRCAFRPEKYCSNNREQNLIIDELIKELPELSAAEDKLGLLKRIRKTRLGGLIEFSRAVHAEMDALLSAGREGSSTVGTRLFVTTFPCHYCARHIVSAGVYEVQYIEPYPKSLALSLHVDAIAVAEKDWKPPELRSIGQERENPALTNGHVLFRPFVGVAPRMYLRAFEKTRGLKDKITGEMEIHPAEWGDEWSPLVSAFPELEAVLSEGI